MSSPTAAQPERDLQRRLLVVAQLLRDLPALPAQRAAHPVQVVGQRGEVAVEVGPRLRVVRNLGGAQLACQLVGLVPERANLATLDLEVVPARRQRLALVVAIDRRLRVVEVLARHAQPQGQIRVQAQVTAQRRREVVERFPRRVDRPL